MSDHDTTLQRHSSAPLVAAEGKLPAKDSGLSLGLRLWGRTTRSNLCLLVLYFWGSLHDCLSHFFRTTAQDIRLARPPNTSQTTSLHVPNGWSPSNAQDGGVGPIDTHTHTHTGRCTGEACRLPCGRIRHMFFPYVVVLFLLFFCSGSTAKAHVKKRRKPCSGPVHGPFDTFCMLWTCVGRSGLIVWVWHTCSSTWSLSS